jgi:hypothetical protein
MRAPWTPSASRRERSQQYRESAPACRPMSFGGSIAKPTTMGTFVGLSQNGLDPEVAAA